MISKLRRIIELEVDLKKAVSRIKGLEDGAPTLSVPVVDESGGMIREYVSSHNVGHTHFLSYHRNKRKNLSFKEVCKALQDMCGIEITYQEIKGKSGVVIYEKDDDR